jgi:hypothetical protein
VGKYLFLQAVAAQPRKPNINSAYGLGPALAAPEVYAVLQQLGLVADGEWTAIAVTLLWRCKPPEWAMEFEHDDRFSGAVKRAVSEVPDAVRKEISDLVTVTQEDIVARIAYREKDSEQEWRKRFGLNPALLSTSRQAAAVNDLEFYRRHQLNWLFFRKWRLEDGWLNAMEQQRSLEIFHDPVAIAMRRAVLGRLYPDRPQFSR